MILITESDSNKTYGLGSFLVTLEVVDSSVAEFNLLGMAVIAISFAICVIL